MARFVECGSLSARPFAVVVVHTDVRPRGTPDLQRTFHYSVPAHLRGLIAPGQLVWVPFGRQEAPGIVVEMADAAPVSATKDILDIIDPQPVLTPYQIRLLFWISEYYQAPLDVTAWNMFPSTMSWNSDTVLRLVTDSVPGLYPNPEERQIIELLHRNGPMSVSAVETALGPTRARRLLAPMVSKGWLERRIELLGARVKPKVKRFVVLSALPDDEALKALDRANKQLSLLQELIQRARQLGLPYAVSLDTLRREVGASSQVVNALAKRGLLTVEEREVRRDPLAGHEFATTEPPPFTTDQQRIWEPIARAIAVPAGQTFLLHGVTGSGKTEVYRRALAHVLEQNGQGIVLVPEIALTPQTIRRFAARFPGRLAVLHSRLSPGERYDEWRRIRDGRADVVIGSRSAIFAPLPRLRLVVIDEEHEWTYKNQSSPYYHAREVAVRLAELAQATVILGSATPDIESYYRATRGEYVLLQLPHRVVGHRSTDEDLKRCREISVSQERTERDGDDEARTAYMDLPKVSVVDMRAELQAGNRSIFSRALQAALQKTLHAQQQAILFINRRGAASFVMCRDCGLVMRCPNCDVALTFHSAGEQLTCHHCNYRMAIPYVCPTCMSRRIRYFGVGTQRVDDLMHELFPHARTLRWDRDVTDTKDAHERILIKFATHQADVLIGTQMIAKGLDLPLVTLVGVVAADTGLQLPDFRAGERTFQLLTQVAGRAGRSIRGGSVILQTYAPQHFAIQAAAQHDWDAFYRHELAFRRRHGYPPFNRLVRLVYQSESELRCRGETELLRQQLSERIRYLRITGLDIIGPAPCFIGRERRRHRWHLILRGRDPVALLAGFDMPRGWKVDVDPASLL